MAIYRISGLIVDSPIALPGLTPLALSTDVPQVRIRIEALSESLERPLRTGPVWELDEHCFLLNLPDMVRIRATAGQTLDIDPAPDVAAEDVLPLALGTGMAALLYQRGAVILHGAAVACEGRGYVLCGPSGRGKSTLAAALCKAGCQFISDDVTVIDLGADRAPVVWPDGRCLKLFNNSIDHLELAAGRGSAVRSGIAKFYVAPPRYGMADDNGTAPLPLAGIYLLRDLKPSLTAGIERLSPMDSAQALLNQAYRRQVALAMAKAGRSPQVAVTAAVLKHVPVFRLTRPRDLTRLGQDAARLMSDWRAQVR